MAQRQGRLHRNFQGYSTHADADLVACGVSAIGAVGPTYSQNVKTLEAYYERARQQRAADRARHRADDGRRAAAQP